MMCFVLAIVVMMLAVVPRCHWPRFRFKASPRAASTALTVMVSANVSSATKARQIDMIWISKEFAGSILCRWCLVSGTVRV